MACPDLLQYRRKDNHAGIAMEAGYSVFCFLLSVPIESTSKNYGRKRGYILESGSEGRSGQTHNLLPQTVRAYRMERPNSQILCVLFIFILLSIISDAFIIENSTEVNGSKGLWITHRIILPRISPGGFLYLGRGLFALLLNGFYGSFDPRHQLPPVFSHALPPLGLHLLE